MQQANGRPLHSNISNNACLKLGSALSKIYMDIVHCLRTRLQVPFKDWIYREPSKFS